MKDLKTLKNINNIIMKNGDEDCPSLVIKAYNLCLKKEAINWIKFIKKDMKEMHPKGSYYHEGQIDWIMLFFNITDDEVKDG